VDLALYSFLFHLSLFSDVMGAAMESYAEKCRKKQK